MASGRLRVIGLISGTSADGIDGVCVELPASPSLADVRSLVHHHVALTPGQRDAVFASFHTATATADFLCRLNADLGEWFASAALETIANAGLTPGDIDVVASHGQTVFHDPPVRAGDSGSTLQLGEPSVIAERTGVTTVADFRVRDMAAGGHGAPLVSFLDDRLFRLADTTRVLLNLGGIGNITVLPPFSHGADAPRIACDTGPANMVLDWIVSELTGGASRFDDGGRMASAGIVDEVWLRDLLDDDYFRAPAPKTTGRERYGAQYAARVLAEGRGRGLPNNDILATITAMTGATVASDIVRNAPDRAPVVEVVAGGGGARNPAIMSAIAARIPGVRLSTVDEYGIASQAKEALLFAMLGNAAIRGNENTVASSTGARHATVMGKIVPGSNYRSLMSRLFHPDGSPPSA
ncbi:MAG: anhydro-N-acetylmuramic acid kinase [Chloroflexi bacterium]|nr:anhydro-N-acetylmuramic acid kinase [Chloroflexota bacterium]